jgi:hypothetical protein
MQEQRSIKSYNNNTTSSRPHTFKSKPNGYGGVTGLIMGILKTKLVGRLLRGQWLIVMLHGQPGTVLSRFTVRKMSC